MSLYLTIFDNSEEVTGWVFGHYSDFGYFRDKIRQVSNAELYPLLMAHSDCDGAWDVSDLDNLKRELQEVARIFRALPPEDVIGAFEHTAECRGNPQSLYDCFHNVDGKNVFEALTNLCDEAFRLQKAILFQ